MILTMRPWQKGLVALLMSTLTLLGGLVSPVRAAPSTISVINATPIASSGTTLSTGDTISIYVCFQGEVDRALGTGNADVKLFLNTRAATGISWAGARESNAGGTNNCLVFPYTVLSTDTSQVSFGPTSLTLANSATLTVTGFDTISATTTALSGGLCSNLACGGASVFLSVDVTAPTASTYSPADSASDVASTSNLVLTTTEAATPYISVTSRSCAGGNTATVVAQRDHDVVVGDLIYPYQVGPNYDAGTGSKTYFRVTAVTGRNISYAIGCTNESSTMTGGVIAPLRYVTVAADADTAKTITNIAIASNVATLTSTSHGFVVGDVVLIAGLSQKESNGAFVVTAADANTFAVNLTKAAAGTAASSANVANVSDLGSTAAAGGSTALRVVEAIPTLDSTRVAFTSVSPFTMTVNPSATLPGSTAVHVKVGAGAIRDGRANAFAGISNATTWNFTTATSPAVVTNITSSTSDGCYRSGGATSIQVRFNQSVTVAGGNPELTLNSGASAVATYASGSGTNTLTFTYTIGAIDSTLAQSGQRLNVTGFNLPAGVTMSGVTASTAVPASMASGSLNANKNIVIDNTAPAPQGFMPFPGAVGVQATQALSLIFPENMAVVNGKKLFIYRATGNILHETITIGAQSETAITQFPNNSGALITITRTGKTSTQNLVIDPATSYYVTFEAGAFTDLAGNPNAALTSTTAWRFEASPDTVAPVLNVNQSDPPHNMPNFVLDRNIELAFSEAVSTVATKTIRLCTGDADCATPVETFTFPSASVTSSKAGMGVVLNPAANLTASTTYFLLIDSGAFVDGAGNATASAVTAGQYQFTAVAPPVSAPSGGGGAPAGPGGPVGPAPIGPAPTNCGPPPLPPCNVGPGINFGPGGMIQNPNALNGSDMVNLRPDNFMGFRPDDARSLGAGALQNFQPNQFAALPPTAMAGFDRNQINNLNPAAMAGFNQNQMAQLPPEAMAGFRPDQMAQLPPTAMAGFRPDQMAQLPPTAMVGFKPDQMAALPPEAMAGFKPDQFSVLPPSAMTGFKPDQFAQLPPAAMAGFKPDQFAQLPPNAMAGFRPDQFAQLPPTAMVGFKPDQMAALPPAAMAGFKPQQLSVLPPSAMTGLKPDQMAELPPAAMAGMQLSQFKVLPPAAMTGIQQDQFAALPPQAMIGFKPAQFAALPPDAMAGMQQNQFKVIPASAMKVFTPNQMDSMPPTALAVISPLQFKSLSPEVIASMSTEQRQALPQQAFNPAANAAPTNVGNATALAGALTGWNVDKVPANAFSNFKPTDAAKLSPETFSAMNPGQFKAMPPTAFTGFKPAQVGALAPEVIASIKPTQLGAIPANAFGSFNPEQVGALPAAAFGAMKPTQVGALPPAAMASMTPQQVGALPPTAMAGLKANQVEALPAESIVAMKPAAVAALTAKSAAGFSNEKLAAMTPAQEKALKPAFVKALTPEQKAALNS